MGKEGGVKRGQGYADIVRSKLSGRQATAVRPERVHSALHAVFRATCGDSRLPVLLVGTRTSTTPDMQQVAARTQPRIRAAHHWCVVLFDILVTGSNRRTEAKTKEKKNKEDSEQEHKRERERGRAGVVIVHFPSAYGVRGAESRRGKQQKKKKRD